MYKPAPHWYAARRDDVGDADGDAVTPVIVADGVAVRDGEVEGVGDDVAVDDGVVENVGPTRLHAVMIA